MTPETDMTEAMKMKNGRVLTVSGAMFAVLLMLLGVFAIPGSASAAPTSLNDKLTTETGTTADFGGGHYFFVKFGADAAFGIVWGTNETHNNIYFVAVKARYIGMAQVYDTEGGVVAKNVTIKIYTIYAVKLDDMLEFNDSNSDGVLQGHRIYSGGTFTGDYAHIEPIFKKVDLNTSWEQSPVRYAETADSRTWSFDLSAKDLPYIQEDNYSGPAGDNKLNELNFTFHLAANMVQVDNASLPQWRITVTRGMMGAMWSSDIQQMPDMILSGKMISYHAKWDQKISGWDYDVNDTNPALQMEFEAIIGNYIPPMLAMTWMRMALIQNMNEAGTCTARSPTGTLDVNENTGVMSMPRPLSSPMLTFGGERTRIGQLEWVSNVTVDGNMDQMHAQVMGGVPILSMAMSGVQSGAIFAGFAILGGLIFPGGAVIVHDPTFSSEALVDVGGRSTQVIPIAILGIMALIAVMVVIVVLAVVLMGKKPGQKTAQTYERATTLSSQPGAWQKYYEKK